MTRSRPSTSASAELVLAGRSIPTGGRSTTASDGANRSISAFQFAISDAGTTSRHGSASGRALLLQGEQQGDHLDGLAEAHVVGEARPEAEPRHEAQPAQPAALVGAQLGVQPRRAGDLPRLRATRAGPASPRGPAPAAAPSTRAPARARAADTSRSSVAPDSRRIPSKNVSPSAWTCPRRPSSGRAPRASFSRSTSTHLPLSRTSPPDRVEELADLVLAQRLAVQRDADGEVEQRIDAELGPAPAVDLHVDDRRAAGGCGFHQSGTRTISPLSSKTGMSCRKRCASCGDHASGWYTSPESTSSLTNVAPLRRALEGHEQRQERLLVLGPGVCLQRPAQRLVLRPALRPTAGSTYVARNANGCRRRACSRRGAA